MAVWKEFRKFVARGSFFDLAIGIVIGAAFGTVVNSLVKDILMPPIGLLTAGSDFSELYINLSGEEYASLTEATHAGGTDGEEMPALHVGARGAAIRRERGRVSGSNDPPAGLFQPVRIPSASG